MLLTQPQVNRFWSKRADKPGWPVVVAIYGWSTSEAETQRKALLARCGFTSLTQVDPDKGFTRVLEEIAIFLNDLNGLQHAAQNKRRQKLFKIRSYEKWLGIAQDRFHTTDLDSLTDQQIDELLWTCSDRQVEHRPKTVARRRQANAARRKAAKQDPNARPSFPGLAIGDPAPAYETDPEKVPF